MSRKSELADDIAAGLISNRPTLKKYLEDKHGRACQICEGSRWMDNPIPLELDHIDGNAGNNNPSNLRLICPNCHAMTPTAKGRNKGSGRGTRGLPRN